MTKTRIYKHMKSSTKLLEKFLGEASLLIDIANEQFSGLSEAQINWKPSEKKWSIGECLDHLAATHKLYNSKIKELQPFVEHPGEDSLKFKHTFSGRMILKYVDPNSTTRTKTFKVFKPSMRQINTNTISSFCEEVEMMISFAEKLHGVRPQTFSHLHCGGRGIEFSQGGRAPQPDPATGQPADQESRR